MSVRRLFFNLHIRLPRKKGVAIGITSALPNEGKSTIATCLAFAASIKKQRIAVVDFDMWHHGIDFLTELTDPEEQFIGTGEKNNNLYGGADFDESPSLEDWFTKNKPLNRIKTKIEGFDAVDIYPWAIRDHDSFVDLDEVSVRKLFKKLRADYDLIIVDTAPFMLVSEVSVLTTELDGFIVVTAWEVVTDLILKDLKRAMDLANINIIGCVLNRVDPKKQKQYGLSEYIQYYNGPDGYT